MKKVGIPYEILQDKLYMPSVIWPQKCVCCGKETDKTTFDLEHKARYASTTSGSTTTSNYYPLEWKVPCCERCRDHATQASNLFAAIVVLTILAPIILVIVLGAESSTLAFLLLLVASVVIGVTLYQVLLRLLVFSKMTGSCAHYGNALFATDDAGSVVFHFYRDELAEHFAQLNNAKPIDAEKPNFWRLKKSK